MSFFNQNQYLWVMFLLIPLMMAWIISIIAETHRDQLDFFEGESELVSGFNIEYSSSLFALIFMAEYMNILLMSLITASIMTKNFSTMEMIAKTTLLSFLFIWTRGALPRMRYDILMSFLRKKLPLSLMMLLMIIPMMMKMSWYCASMNG